MRITGKLIEYIAGRIPIRSRNVVLAVVVIFVSGLMSVVLDSTFYLVSTIIDGVFQVIEWAGIIWLVIALGSAREED